MPKPPGKLAGHLRDNRGSGLVTVMVTMLFVSVLGVTLLFTSYTGYLIKVSERGGKESFYSAGTAMDEIKIGIQEAVNDSLAIAYTQVLSEYTRLSADELQGKFADYYYAAFKKWTVDGTPATALFSASGTGVVYNTGSLIHLMKLPAGAEVTVNGGAANGTVAEITDVAAVLQEIILEDIRVDYLSPDGYASSVSTDISVSMPDFYATTSTVMSSSLPSYALVAEDGLNVSSGVRTLSGSAYAGALTLRNNGSKLSFQSGILVCKGDLTAEGDVEFTAGAGTELWAGNIELGTSSRAMLYGKTYVADDLTLAGRGARAELKGSYCGFGAGTDAGTSSAIVINGKNTVFDMDGLDRLILAGVSFLDTPGSAVRTGESVSVKSNQLAYLADGSCLTLTPFFDTDGDGELDAGESAGTVSGGNPYVWTGNMLLYSVADQTLWTIGGVSRRLSDYGAEVRPVLKNIVGAENYQLAYFFLHFSSQDRANQYFKDFFTARPEKIAEYIGDYTQLGDKAKSISGAGHSLYASGGALSLAEAVPSVDVSGQAGQFANRCQTLDPNKSSADPAETPFTYFVNAGAIPPGVTEFYLPGDTHNAAALVIHNAGGYAYPIDSGTASTVKVVIATGDVIINRRFDGLILTGGTIVQNANIYSDPDAVQDILHSAAAEDGTKLPDAYLRNAVLLGGESGTTRTSWDLDILVSYRNWAKH